MEQSSHQPDLGLDIPSNPDIIHINSLCTVKKEGPVSVVYVAGLAMHHWTDGDRMAEAYAMVGLVRYGYADQNDVARAFGYSPRTLRRDQDRFEAQGMAALGRSAGRPHGARAAPTPWIRTARALHREKQSLRDIAYRLGVSKDTVNRWLDNPNTSSRTANAVTETTSHPIAGKAMAGSSVDPDPEHRLLDRALARVGLLEDAEPIFVPGRRIPHAGVLLAVPALVHNGIFSVADEVYGHIGPAFYGLRTTMMALSLMAMLRIKRLEWIKEHAPVDMGRLLGLDRAPEVKTLRRKLSRLAELGKAEAFGRKLAERRVASHGTAMGFLYIDGHVRVYHGKWRLPKTHITRMRMSLPATTDYWVNDKAGDPLFVVTAEVNASLAQMLPLLLKEVRALIGPRRRVTVVFDRGGWSPKLFIKLIASSFDILTYRKGHWKHIPRNQFARCDKMIEGRQVAYNLNDRNIRLLKGRLKLRQITRLSEDGHQTPIVTSRLDLPAVVLAYRMFERWRQENFFKYLRDEFALDALMDYRVEAEESERTVPNPQRSRMEKKLRIARAELKEAQALYGEAVTANVEKTHPTIRGFKIAHGELGRKIQEAQRRIAFLKQRRNQMPARVAVRELDGKPLMRLSRERKHLTDCLKMVAYQSESDLLALIRPHYARADDEGRTLVASALQSAADIKVVGGKLHVTLAPLSSPHRTRAVAALCTALNEMGTCFPGTKLRLHFGITS